MGEMHVVGKPWRPVPEPQGEGRVSRCTALARTPPPGHRAPARGVRPLKASYGRGTERDPVLILQAPHPGLQSGRERREWGSEHAPRRGKPGEDVPTADSGSGHGPPARASLAPPLSQPLCRGPPTAPGSWRPGAGSRLHRRNTESTQSKCEPRAPCKPTADPESSLLRPTRGDGDAHVPGIMSRSHRQGALQRSPLKRRPGLGAWVTHALLTT